MRASQTLGIALVGATAVGLGVAGARWANPTKAAPLTIAQSSVPASDLRAAALQDTISRARRNAIVLASQRVAPSVVTVSVQNRAAARPRTMLESFFFPETNRPRMGMGSGFIIRADGLVLTNEHVVRGAAEIVVTLPDGRDFAAQVAGVDEVSDLALLRLRDARDLPVAPLGNSQGLIIGEWAIAIGNPFGFALSNAEPTVTAGVISGVGRNIIPNGSDTEGLYLDMIQTDASINPGNSGGPLVNALGEVIGVNSSIISASGGNIGLGFAIPIDRAQRIAADLLASGHVRRAWIGADAKAAAPNSFGRSRFVELDQVAEGSPAARAGLRTGMQVLRVGGRPVYNPLDWQARVIDARVDQPLDIVVNDAGRERAFRLTPADVPSLAAERVRVLSDELELITLTSAIRSERRMVSQRGALIVNLSPAAQRVGLRQGDVIVEINRVGVRSAEEVAQVMRQLEGRGVRLTIERHGEYLLVSFYVQ
ncbi:MAG: trypsin-like peptidase domain-containing protein [Longimicrobiales bacterium]